MSLMEGKEDIFKEFKEKFKSTYMVSDSPLIIIVSRVCVLRLVLHDWLYFLVKKSQMYFRYSYIIICTYIFYDTFK